jgi:hypothetical protein
MTRAKQGKSTVAALAEKLIAGTGKHLGNVTQVMLTGGSYTPAEVTSKLRQIVTLRSSVDAARSAAQTKLAAEKADMPALRVFLDAYVAHVMAAFGNLPDVLADFGLAPKKARSPVTSEVKAAAAAKRKATRAARHTMGSKQKQAVKGDVVGITVTPVTADKPIEQKAPVSPTVGTTSPDPKVGATPHTAT